MKQPATRCYLHATSAVRAKVSVSLAVLPQRPHRGLGDHEIHVADSDADPVELLRDHRLRTSLVQAIQSLPEREQHIMGMYYEQEMHLKEIGLVLGVTESRISQLHSQAVARLRTKLKSWI